MWVCCGYMNRHIKLHPIPSENKPGGPKRAAVSHDF